MSKQSKLVRYIIANPPKYKGGTQDIGHQGYQDAEDAIAAAEAAAASTGNEASLSVTDNDTSSDSVDSDSSDDGGDSSASAARVAPEPEPEPRRALDLTQLLADTLADGGWKSVISKLKSICGSATHAQGEKPATDNAGELLAWLQRAGGAAIAEATVETDSPTAAKAVAKVLYTLYELDLVEAPDVLSWAERCAVEQPLVSHAVRDVVEFLAADTDDDDEDSSTTDEETAND